MSSSSDSFRVAILLYYHVLCDTVCLWVARDFNISNLGYERRLPPSRELPGAGLPHSPVLSQSVDGESRGGPWVNGEREMLLPKQGSWALMLLRYARKRAERSFGKASSPEREEGLPLVFPTLSKDANPWLGNKQSFLFCFLSFFLFSFVGFKWWRKANVLIQLLRWYAPQHGGEGNCSVHWKRRDLPMMVFHWICPLAFFYMDASVEGTL